MEYKKKLGDCIILCPREEVSKQCCSSVSVSESVSVGIRMFFKYPYPYPYRRFGYGSGSDERFEEEKWRRDKRESVWREEEVRE